MEQFASLDKKPTPQRSAAEKAIREKGKEIYYNCGEHLSIRARATAEPARTSRSISHLRNSIPFSCRCGHRADSVRERIVVKPLKSLEWTMKSIADGKFSTIAMDSSDQEIVSLADAFNKMIKELEMRQRNLVQSEKLASLGTLLSGVAHELNNPLSNISTSCQILSEEMDELDPEYRRELLSQIEDQADRAKNIVRSLLEFSRAKEFKRRRGS